jgi:hypothetical protein
MTITHQRARRCELAPPLTFDAGTCPTCGAAVIWIDGLTAWAGAAAAGARVPFDTWPRAPIVTPLAGGRRFEVYGVVHWFTCDGGRAALEAL